ncbi:putative SGNH hydrolase-type esterase domain-containing protein [Seiridium unicorne]|uniref:SGNH hydrolase-type esterase domain-containing protein n=1 Tax=Seiridium unicorne TaxID=138068 RepID=A0ABR2V886_9PEZI
MAASYDQVVLFGDSLFQGAADILEGFSFQAALQKRESALCPVKIDLTDLVDCIRRLDVVNRGFSGWNTDDALRYLPEIFPAKGSDEGKGPRLRYLLVLLGANDACHPWSHPSQFCAKEDYKAKLKKIITHPNIVAHQAKVLLVTPPPLDETRIYQYDIEENGLDKLTRTAANSAEYSQVARDVAAEVPGTILIDLQDALIRHAISLTSEYDAKNPHHHNGRIPLLGYMEGNGGKGFRGALGQLLPDGLHLSGEAYKVFFSLVFPHIGPFPAALDGPGEKSEFANPFPDWSILAAEREEKYKAKS